VTDALATIAAFPLASIAIIGFAIAALAQPDAKSLLSGLMPIAFAGCAITIADIASRERRAGTSALVFAAPGLRARFVWWKFASALIVALAFLAVPLVRALAFRPSSALPLLIGIVFTTAAATTLGIVSANPKTFIVGFLTYWYIVLNDKGMSPALDFAGWFGTATPIVLASYALASLALLIGAELFHRWDLRRRW
jgi:ABC-type transport system involved in multi-copper enzyme maturation permease subunit